MGLPTLFLFLVSAILVAVLFIFTPMVSTITHIFYVWTETIPRLAKSPNISYNKASMLFRKEELQWKS